MIPIPFIFHKRSFKYQKSDSGQVRIWDIIRRRYVSFTPEEHVRQHIIHSLIEEYNIPRAWISVEKSLRYNGLVKRYDILVYKNAEAPFLIVECKAPDIELDDSTLLQLSIYHSQLPSEYLMVSNGQTTCLARVSEDKLVWLEEWGIEL